MRTSKRKTHRDDTPEDVRRDVVNQVVVDGKSIYRVALTLDISRHTLARYVKLRLDGQAIFQLKTKFSHRLVLIKTKKVNLLII